MTDPPCQFSRHARRRIERRQISEVWILLALAYPDRVDPDRDDPTLRHALKKIAECDNRVLRVIYNDSIKPPGSCPPTLTGDCEALYEAGI